MKITSDAQEGLKIITLSGEIDMNVSPRVGDALVEACKTCTRGVVVDLSAVTYMDSSGIATLVEGLQWSKKACGRFMIVGVQSNVMNTLRLAKLHELFEIYSTHEEALASLNKDKI